MEWDLAASKMEQFLRTFLEASAMEVTTVITRGAEGERTQLRVAFEGPEARFLVARNAELLHAIESLAAGILRLEPEEHDLISFDAEGYKAGRAEHIERAARTAEKTVAATGRPFAFPPMNSRERRMLHMELANSGLRSASSGEAARRYVVLYPAGAGATEAEGGSGREVRETMPGESIARASGAAGGKVGEGGDRARVIRSAFRPR